jgi:hypothetical protein
MKIKKTHHPVKLLEALKSLTIKLRQIVSENSALIHEVEPHEKNVQRFEFNEGKFYFEITDFRLHTPSRLSPSIPEFLYYQTPASSVAIGQTGRWATEDTIIKKLNHWIGLLKRVSNLDFDEITTKYEEEVFENFKILDKDADTAPFDDNQQVVMLNYLSEVRKYLSGKSNEYPTKPIVDQIDRLANEISSSAKNLVMRKLSAILARVKKLSLLLYREVVTVFRREVIKHGLNDGYDYLKNNVEKIIDAFKQLPS